jgi:hypothetical protein
MKENKLFENEFLIDKIKDDISSNELKNFN